MARNNVTFADLVAIARRVGVEVIEAPSSHRGKLGKMGTAKGVTCHHTGTPNTFRPAEDYPDFNVVKEGRAGLVNSLSAWGIGRRKAIYVFSEFLSWHAGEWSYAGITDGNGHFLGIEAAGIGDWTDWQRQVYPRLVASALLFIGEPAEMAPRHADGALPRGRKSDAANFAWFNERVRFFMANPAYININYTGPTDIQEDEEIMFTSIAPGTAQVIPLPEGKKLLSLAVDEGTGGHNVRVAASWGFGKYTSVGGFDKADGFTGWVKTGEPARIELNGAIQSVTVTHYEGADKPLGVTVVKVA